MLVDTRGYVRNTWASDFGLSNQQERSDENQIAGRKRLDDPQQRAGGIMYTVISRMNWCGCKNTRAAHTGPHSARR